MEPVLAIICVHLLRRPSTSAFIYFGVHLRLNFLKKNRDRASHEREKGKEKKGKGQKGKRVKG
jgi:hypothetical protein